MKNKKNNKLKKVKRQDIFRYGWVKQRKSPIYIYIYFEKQKDNYFQILENENNVICIKTEKSSNGYFF